MDTGDPRLRPGRGALSNPTGRFEVRRYEPVDDGWGIQDELPPPLETIARPEASRSVISRNDSPDIPFSRSINPYRGCEHGCVYCYARPSHAFLNLSPGLDFETRLFFKDGAVRELRRELSARGYRCEPVHLGANTDPYQPLERRLAITRGVLEVLLECRHPVTITTKSALILRDRDLLAAFAREGLVHASLSITTLDVDLKRRLEPRAPGAAARLAALGGLTAAGVPAGVLVAPVIPVLTDHELERILEAARDAGAQDAGYVVLRLPGEVRGLWLEWLQAHYPGKAAHVMSVLRNLRGGSDNDPRFGRRMRGQGVYADLLGARFHAACRRLGLATGGGQALDASKFRPPVAGHGQLEMF